jgi:predicted dehydrogenase
MDLRIGIIGLGRMGMMHGALLNSLDGCALVAAADPSRFPAAHLAKLNPQIAIFKDAGKMLDRSELDAVVIASPVWTHVELASMCVDRGIPFLLEKPYGLSAESGSVLRARLEENPVTNMMGYVYRFQESFRLAKSIVDQGCLGPIVRGTAHIYISQLFSPGKGWRYDRSKSGGGVLIGLGSHIIDLITWYLGPVNRVVGSTNCVYSKDIEDFSHLLLRHDGGLWTTVDCSWSVRFKRKMDVRLTVQGERGHLDVSDDTLTLFLDEATDEFAKGLTVMTAKDLYQPVPVDIGTPKFTRQDLSFINCVKSGAPASPDVIQGFRVQQVVDAGYQSSQAGGTPIDIA